MKVERVPIGDLLELQRRDVDVRPDRDYQEIGVRSFGKGLFIKPPVLGAELGDKRVFAIRRGDFIVSNVFAWEGAVGVATKEHDGLIGSHRFMTWTPRGDVNVEYLRHYFGSEAGVESLASASPGSAGRNRTLSIKNFQQLAVPTPQRFEQDRIVAHLAGLSTIARPEPELGLPGVREWVFRSLTMNGTAFRKLREMVRPRPPEPVLPDKAYPIGGVFGFARGIIHRPSLLGAETKYQTLTLAREHDVVYSKLKAFEGAVAVIRAQDSGRYFSPEFPVFEQTATDVHPGYLEQVLLSPPILRALAEQSTGVGARRERVHPAKFLDLEVPIPTQAQQESVTGLCRRVAESESLVGRAKRLATAILPAARNEIFNSIR